ncbi:MAG: hypothetical protein LBD57_04470 [Endomicrobium sp.]|jgi:hypothetical protein|uniref:hypothetical protein n=1 Tax=Candidatus Endomicrobiellum cubanum TaxID=3242325 RepID=UPI002836D704|nr:hypothetical protein [Endomicrobium sp.]
MDEIKDLFNKLKDAIEAEMIRKYANKTKPEEPIYNYTLELEAVLELGKDGTVVWNFDHGCLGTVIRESMNISKFL